MEFMMFYFSGLLQEGPAQTTDYMLAGYTVIFGIMGIYLISLWIRSRSLKQDLALLEEIEDKEQ
jgi:hypothetical protein